MNKREMKKRLKAFLAREIWYNAELLEKFIVLEISLTKPISKAERRRLEHVILEYRQELNK